MSNHPFISVLLPVYNCADYVKESVESILNQTYPHFELLIINDGSRDDSERIINSIQDTRIRYIPQKNQGLATTLNNGIALSRGTLLARQDADDVSLPTRFEEQVRFLNAHPEIMLLGTHAQIMNSDGQFLNRFHRHATASAELKTDLLFDNPFVHSSVMFRKDILKKSGNYLPGDHIFEDHNLWSSISNVAEIANIPMLLVNYRQVSSGISQSINNYKVRVFNQSFQNCLPYVEKKQEQDLKNSIAIYHSCFDKITGDTPQRQLEELFYGLLFNFSKKHNYTLSEMNATKHQLHFRRSYYSYKIDSGIFPKPVVLYYKMKRKLFFSSNENIAHR
jgi:glycosyltransferase involved in cell wall biosynthesis